jgi:hypothetical protein
MAKSRLLVIMVRYLMFLYLVISRYIVWDLSKHINIL